MHKIYRKLVETCNVLHMPNFRIIFYQNIILYIIYKRSPPREVGVVQNVVLPNWMPLCFIWSRATLLTWHTIIIIVIILGIGAVVGEYIMIETDQPNISWNWFIRPFHMIFCDLKKIRIVNLKYHFIFIAYLVFCFSCMFIDHFPNSFYISILFFKYKMCPLS